MRSLLIGALAAISCHPSTGYSGGGGDVDSLWSLAPDATTWGVVANPRAIGYTMRTLEHLRVLADDPDLAMLRGVIAPLDTVFGGPSRKLADIGLSSEGGAAIFGTKEGVVIVLPVANRDKVIAALHGERGKAVDHLGDLPCKPIKNVYACASQLALFDRMGKGKLVGRAESAGGRGDVEAYMSTGTLGSHGEGFATVAFDDGELSLHGFLAGTPPSLAPLVGRPRPHIETNRAAGFIAIDLAPLLAELPSLALPGRDWQKLVHSVRGPIVATMSAATNDLDVHVPLTDTGPLESLVNHCDALAAVLPIAAKPAAGACHVTISAPYALELEVWVEDKELRVATHKGSHPLQQPSALSAVGKELAADEWTFAAWGHGSLLAPGFPLPAKPDDPGYTLLLRAMAQVSEAGVGLKIAADGVHARGYLRTIWTNPLAIAGKLAGVSALELTSGRAAATGQDLANKSPGTPFAGDFAAGQAGILAPFGLVAAVALPAFYEYTKRSTKTEAQIELNKLNKNLKVYYLTNGAFPVADLALAPPVACCDQNYEGKHKCSPDADPWLTDPVWQVLDFAILEPHDFQYAYQSDGHTFTALAVGDLDCDKTMITYTLKGTAVDGRVEGTLIEPPPNSD